MAIKSNKKCLCQHRYIVDELVILNNRTLKMNIKVQGLPLPQLKSYRTNNPDLTENSKSL